jgi:cell division protein FtsZ
VLLSIQGGSDLGLFEINEAAQLVSNSAAVDANIIFGAVIDDALGDEVRVTVIAAGLGEDLTGRAVGAVPDAADSGAFGSNGSTGSAFSGPAGHHAGNGASAAGIAVPAASASVLSAPVPDNRTSKNAVLRSGPAGLQAPAAQAPADQAPAAQAPADQSAAHEAARQGPADAPHSPPSTNHASSPATRFSPPPSAAPHVPRQGSAEAPGKTFDVAATRRRPVVFEEDDDLDVPDFLK